MSDNGSEKLSRATELAYEFVQKTRSGECLSRKEYHARLSTKEERDEFDFCVSMDGFVQGFADAHADLELKQALSELPRDGPDIVKGGD